MVAWFEFFVMPHFLRKIHHKVPPNRERELWAVIFLDQRQRQVDPRSQTRGSVKRAILDQAAFVIDPQGWITPAQIAGEAPMCSDFAPVEQAGRCQRINTGADRSDSARF